MHEPFADILTAGGKLNSLGRADEVVKAVLEDKSRLQELYDCLSHEDAWVRMRAVDSLEKVCRVHPDWLEPYIDKLIYDFSSSTQPSILWHLAQIYSQVSLTAPQKATVINWLKSLLSSKNIDWIVAANSMETLVRFTQDGSVAVPETRRLLEVQQHHKSNAVKKRAAKFLAELSQNNQRTD